MEIMKRLGLILLPSLCISLPAAVQAGSGVHRAMPLGEPCDIDWSGWLDGSENILSGGSFENAQGEVLEGTPDLAMLFGNEPPENLYVAATGSARRRFASTRSGASREQALEIAVATLGLGC